MCVCVCVSVCVYSFHDVLPSFLPKAKAKKTRPAHASALGADSDYNAGDSEAPPMPRIQPKRAAKKDAPPCFHVSPSYFYYNADDSEAPPMPRSQPKRAAKKDGIFNASKPAETPSGGGVFLPRPDPGNLLLSARVSMYRPPHAPPSSAIIA